MTEQQEDTAPAPQKPPVVKVEKGNPTPEQVAMITAIIAAKAAGGGPAVPPTRDEWGRPVDRLRPHWASATSFCTQPW
ncbi:MAG TPA: acyl-CoA carboxylase epsilon subunit [Gordonia sp. (in: high G+C Gram-positive bacteria)]|uniref:acyl-CoA carboxylase epsilon subunit n=1 Tax=unclassified Gordonia (in: high G+C Gram-positive bacteria) TaxID=2657482 RepID=UPI000FA781B9|nr:MULTISPECIES: acyl-CoA carboxylase epsilon subunit [unclassified Gordonia (in: high G+C Gram-positive bacteria)]RUP35442.1 MAG: acyl-CoA carboxylase subunit epsilon [Gordonia sp. (in: high G+C Gram-positive bacteria)]HNP55497.1 acyl-CoA carboxylase epsilon subunit [Gordonia sp. (in: high G+C Gram-positive bacteria)]HRC51295.1 acyl-CoA carboxylase epsilon subunit [Gordonia sp. (in: high G+C Gram-positive bacteria)]